MNMKKFLLSALCALGLVGTASAQDVFAKGDQFVNVGIGVSAGKFTTSFPPLSVGYERSIVDGLIENGSIGLGAEAEYRGYKYTYFGGEVGRGHSFFIGPRASFHYQFVERLDTYAGLSLGLYYHTSFIAGDKVTSEGNLAFRPIDLHLGARYLFTDKLGVFAELGSGIATFKVGATFSF